VRAFGGLLVAGIALLATAAACSSSSAPPSAAKPRSDAGAPTTDASPDSEAPGSLDSGAGQGSDAATDATAMDAAGIVASRPYTLHVPSGYDPTKPTPLVVMFHGYSADGSSEELYMGLTEASDASTFLYAYGDGTLDKMALRFWNATNACCDLDSIPVDDVAYFDAIVADVSSKYNVDRKRIYEVGHSNGGFMGHRLACDRASTLAAVVSLAGAQWDDPTRCNPSEPVSVVELHGDADAVVDYNGGSTTEGTYPSAPATVNIWGAKDGCTGGLSPTGQMLDVDTTLPGSETVVSAFGGCPPGIDVQLWRIQGGSHIPTISRPGFAEMVWGFLSVHHKL
jgi:polyhydroxybutyrate depolymerase